MNAKILEKLRDCDRCFNPIKTKDSIHKTSRSERATNITYHQLSTSFEKLQLSVNYTGIPCLTSLIGSKAKNNVN